MSLKGHIQALISFVLFVLVGSSAHSNITEQMAACDTARHEESAGASEKVTFNDWLRAQIKGLGYENAQVSVAAKTMAPPEVAEFSVSGTEFPAKVKYAKSGDAKAITANLVDVGKGTLQELKAIGNLDGRVWLAEVRPDLVPNPLILALSAKAHQAPGLVVYEGRITFPKQKSPVERLRMDSPIPIFTVAYDVAEKIKAKINSESLPVPIKIKFASPQTQAPSENVFLKIGPRDLVIMLWADTKNCESAAALLEFLVWAREKKENIQGMVLAFTSDLEDFKQLHPELKDRVIKDFAVEPGSERQMMAQFGLWKKADQAPGALLEVNQNLLQISRISTNLKGIVDGEDLRKFSLLTKKISKAMPERPLSENYELYQIIQPFMAGTRGDMLSSMAFDYKTLRMLHDEVQRGQWDKARGTCKSLSGFWWAENVEMTTFAECKKYLADVSVSAAEPELWLLLNGGKKNLEPVLKLLESDIDSLEGRINEGFFKLERSMESFSEPKAGLTSKTN